MSAPGHEKEDNKGKKVEEKTKKGKEKKIENERSTPGEEESAASEELDEEKGRLKQRILAAAKIAPATGSSSSSSRTVAKAEKEERDRQAMRVAFEESGEVVETARATSSMNMTAMEFRGIAASDEARAFRRAAALERVEDRARASEVQQEVVEPNAIRNPWNQFQHRHRGKGWSMDKMRAEYYKYKRSQQEP